MRVAVESRITKNARRKKNGNPPQFPVCCARTDERTNERMSAEQSPYLIHPQCRGARARPTSLTATVSIFARQIWAFRFGWAHGHSAQPQPHSLPRPTGRLQRACVLSRLLFPDQCDHPCVPDFNSHGILTVVTSSQSGRISQARDFGNPEEPRMCMVVIHTHAKSCLLSFARFT